MKIISALLAGALLSSNAFAAGLYPNSEGFSSGLRGLPTVAAETWLATVMIQKISRNCPEQQDTRSWGGGVIVQFDRATRIAIVVTNSHVVNGCRNGVVNVDIGFLRADSDSRDTSSRYKILKDLPGNDLAILRVEVPKKVVPSIARLALPRENIPVIAIGFPDLKARRDWGVKPENRGRMLQRFSEGTVRTVARRYPLNVGTSGGRTQIHYTPVVLHSADILPGNSGGPLVNHNGEVIGLNTKMIRHLPPRDKDRQGKDNYFYCANQPLTAELDCQNLAISSEFILRELEKIF